MTDILEHSFLKIATFKTLGYWDYDSVSTKSSIRSQFPIVSLSEVLKLRKVSIQIEENKLYKRCRVQLYAKGIVTRDKVYGRDIKTKRQQLCRTNDFLVAEIDAKFGGYGIVPSELEDAIVSSHYFLFTIDLEKLSPQFLSILLRCDQFFKQVKATGSTNYAAIRPYHVLNYLIPLPELKEQFRIVRDYSRYTSESDRLEKQAEESENEIEGLLLKDLQITLNPVNDISANLQVVPYKSSNRWAVDYLLRINSLTDLRSGKYNVMSVREFTTDYQYGLSEKASKIERGIPMVRMNNIVKGELVLDDLKFINLDPKETTNFILKQNDLLFNRTNSKELVGKTAVFDVDGEYTFASYIIRLQLDTSIVNPYFINYLFNSKIGRLQINMMSRQILGQANMNSQELLDLIFPIPPLGIQNAIVNRIAKKQQKIKSHRELASQKISKANTEFIKKVFD